MWSKWKADFELLKLNEASVAKLFKIFKRVEIGKVNPTGLVDIDDFFHCYKLKLAGPKFVRRALLVFDYTGVGRIDFHQFVFGLWVLCSQPAPHWAEFLYDLYNPDLKPELTSSDVYRLIDELYETLLSDPHQVMYVLFSILS